MDPVSEAQREVTIPTRPARPAVPRAGGTRLQGWRSEFPYHWDADDLVSRRQLLHLAVWTSGALFGSTVVIALLGLLRRGRATPPQPVARAGELPEGAVVYFRYPDADDQAMLLHLPEGRFVAYSQQCTHLSCAVYYQRERNRLVCPCHEGVFNPQTGDPVAGPPVRRLPRIRLRQEGEMLYAIGVEP
jgi:nitrite reductase/ring-hydroxylating ferredoxin subunit